MSVSPNRLRLMREAWKRTDDELRALLERLPTSARLARSVIADELERREANDDNRKGN